MSFNLGLNKTLKWKEISFWLKNSVLILFTVLLANSCTQIDSNYTSQINNCEVISNISSIDIENKAAPSESPPS